MKINMLILDSSPQSLNKYVISPGAFAIHADVDVIVLEDIDKRIAGILATPIRVEYSGFAIAVYRFFQSIDTKTPIQVL